MDAANGFSVEEFFAKRKDEHADDEIDLEEGQWPTQSVSPIKLNAHYDLLRQQPYEHVFLAKIPTDKPWEIPAYLRFGGWNECPGPEELVVVLRQWSQRYGVEIYSLSDDAMECTVARPPQTREDAMALAHEQFLVCNDIVSQGTESVALLAASLLKADAWYFWWD